MGRYGQAILTIAGYVVGSYFGYPQLGALVGGLVGSYLFPPELPTLSGPRLSDITQTTSAVGTSIPRGWGTFSIAGSVIYQSDLREIIVSEDVGGKGGASQTVETPTYYQDFGIALSEGEDPIANLGPIAGVRRIWANGKIIYDRRPRQLDETDTQFNVRIAASNVLDEGMVIYLGTEDQLPDPTMEANLGIDNVSAFRGLAWIMFVNWQNKQEDGNKMPLNWKFEVYTSGALDPNAAFEYSNEYLPPWNAASEIPIYGSSAYYNFSVEATGRSYGSGRAKVSGRWPTLHQAQSAAKPVAQRDAPYFMGYSITPHSGSTAARGVLNTVPTESHRNVGRYDATNISLHFNIQQTTTFGRGGNSWPELAAKGMGPGSPLHTNGYWLNNDVHNASTAGVYRWWPGSYETSRGQGADHRITTGRSANPGAVLINGDLIIFVSRKLQPPGDQCHVQLPGMPGYCISVRGNLVRIQGWERVDLSFVHDVRVLARYSTASVQIPGQSINHKVRVVTQYPLNPAVPDTHPNYNNQPFWEAAYSQAVASGVMPAGLVYGVDYPKTQDHYYRRQLTQNVIDTNPIPLNSVMQEILRESGYADADFDVSALASDTVLGYVRTRVMSGRAVVEPLRQSKFFDLIESGVTTRLIKAVKRGGAIVRSFVDDELGVALLGEDAGSKMTTQTADETTLPRSVRVHYLAVSRDYEPGEQISPVRVETAATNDVDIELPMVLEDDEAARIAEVLWAEAWHSRRSHQTSIDGGLQQLEPCDPIEVPIENKFRRVRILSIEDVLPAVRKLELIRDDNGSYISYAVGSTPGYVRPTIEIAGPVELTLLDLPALRDEDDDAGMYAAIRPYLVDSVFRGATIMRGVDGESYTTVAPIGTATPMGVLIDALPEELYTIWDETNSIRVQMQWGELESRTEDAVLGGANAAAIGAHGRWEIIQFRDATLIGEDIWQLSGLLRGRRGTEHNIGTSIVGDKFVMLSMGGLSRVSVSIDDVGAERFYKAVATGTAFADAEAQAIVAGGEALKPFSPVHLDAALEDDGDILLTWIRRGRLGQMMRSGIDIPLSELTESYEVDILIDDVVTRTLEVIEQEAVYTPAMQAEDFISSTTQFQFDVYQISATVGRGHVGSLIVILDDIEAEAGVDVEPDDLEVLDTDAIIVPLMYEEIDEAVAPLTWVRNGNGPRLTPDGLIGDGYQARLRATASLPAFVTSSSGPLYLRATIRAYDCGARNGTADRVASICVNDATANPRLEFAIVDDPATSLEPQIAVRSFTGSMQTKRLSRREWRFACTHPEKTRIGFGVRPQGVLYNDGAVLICEHYQSVQSTCHLMDLESGQATNVFEFTVGLDQVSSIADRPSDGSIWFLDADTQHILEVDVSASFAGGTSVILSNVDLSALASIQSMDWAVIGVDEEGEGGVEYLLIAEFTSGRIYVFDAADVVNGNVILAADRIKRMQGPTDITGITYRDGVLYVAVFGTASSIVAIDFDTWFATGTDDQSYSTYELAQYGAPSKMVGDIDVDPAGNLWMQTEGNASVADDTDWFALWMSPLQGSIDNIFSAYYNGSGTVQVRINDRDFCTLTWTPTPTPAAISIGGPPQAADGQTNGFFVGAVRDVIVQHSDFAPDDFDIALIYEGDGSLQEQTFEIINPDAEDGLLTTGWTNELGALVVRTASPPPYQGLGYFSGGTDLHTTASQRFALVDLLDEIDVTRFDVGDCWIIVKWHAAVFTSQGDRQAMGFRFLDAAQVEISQSISASIGMSPSDIWIPRSYGILIPANTRYIDLIMDMVRVDGSNNDGYIDAISAALYVPVPVE
jgi:hypothetical protein